MTSALRFITRIGNSSNRMSTIVDKVVSNECHDTLRMAKLAPNIVTRGSPQRLGPGQAAYSERPWGYQSFIIKDSNGGSFTQGLHNPVAIKIIFEDRVLKQIFSQELWH